MDTIFIDASIRNRDLPNVKQLRTAKRKADLPDADRDIRPLFSILLRAYEEGERIPGLWNVRKTAVSSFPYAFTSTEGDADNSEIIESAKDQISECIDQMLSYHTDYAAFGKIGFLVEPELDGGAWRYRFLGRYSPIEFDYLNTSGETIIIDQFNPNKKQIVPDNDERYIFVYNKIASRGGSMRAIASQAVMLHAQKTEWVESNQLLKGIIKGSINIETLQQQLTMLGIAVDETVLRSQVDAFKTKIASLTRDQYIQTIEGTDLTNVKAVEPTAWQGFDAIWSRFQKNIEITILGQANTSEMPDHGGSRAATQVLRKVSADISLDDRATIESYINKRLLLPWYRRNYDLNATKAPIKFMFVEDDNEDITANAAVLGTLGSLSPQGFPVLASELKQKTGFTYAGKGEIVLIGGQSNINIGDGENAFEG